jgi:hypothetical protein
MNKEKRDHYFHTHTITTAVAIAPPPHRMYRVTGGLDDAGKFWWTHTEVLGIQTRINRPYTAKIKSGMEPYEHLVDHDALLAIGYSFHGEESSIGAIVIDYDYGMISSDDPLMYDKNTVSDFCHCPWPYDMDSDAEAIRIVSVQIENRLREKLAFRESLKATRKV